jgi:hypothetical protein
MKNSIFILLCLMFIGCVKSPKDLLIEHQWKHYSTTTQYFNYGKPYFDSTSLIIDNKVLSFNEDNTFKFTNNASITSSSYTIIDSNILNMDFGGYKFVFRVLNLDNTKLVIGLGDTSRKLIECEYVIQHFKSI